MQSRLQAVTKIMAYRSTSRARFASAEKSVRANTSIDAFARPSAGKVNNFVMKTSFAGSASYVLCQACQELTFEIFRRSLSETSV